MCFFPSEFVLFRIWLRKTFIRNSHPLMMGMLLVPTPIENIVEGHSELRHDFLYYSATQTLGTYPNDSIKFIKNMYNFIYCNSLYSN